MPLDGTLYEDKILHCLHTAQERIRNPENWCQGVLYRTTDSGVKQFCARGAIIENDVICQEADDLLNRAAAKLGYMGDYGLDNGLVHLNNASDHSMVMRMYDLAQEMRRNEIMELVGEHG